jgi:hypothetical protein
MHDHRAMNPLTAAEIRSIYGARSRGKCRRANCARVTPFSPGGRFS